MSSVNKVIIIGNVGKDPEIRTTNNGSRIANFTIATTESWKNKQTGERESRTEWHKVSVFNDALVGVVERFVKKGSKLYIEGQLQTRKWTDSEGKDNYSTEVVLQAFNGSITLLDSREPASNAEARREASNRAQAPSVFAEDLEDELPY